jgi:pimeloyl-ACP methyl ester carboxylesterase
MTTPESPFVKFTSPQGRRLALRHHRAQPGALTFVWLSGFNSDMSGTKATRMAAWAQAHGHGYLAFDYSGHGQSEGQFADGTISAWREDALAAIDQAGETPLVLIGSSMGGWMALLAALARPERVRALVLIAPAPDFTSDLLWPELSPPAQQEILDKGQWMRPSAYGAPYPITRALIEDGKRWSILGKPILFHGPVHILQGMADPDVPWRHALRLVDALASADVTLTLIKHGDHRLSREEDLIRLEDACAKMVAAS